MALQIDIHLPDGVSQRWQTLKDSANASINSLANSAHQFRVSLQETATQSTDKAINAVTTTIEQAKGALEHSWQSAEEIKSTTSGAIQTTISSAVGDWLAKHPVFFRLVETLSWATNHPMISLVILLFAIAIAWSIIKAIVRLIETASWSILQVPLKLLQSLIKVSFLSLTKVGSLAVQQITGAKTSEVMPVSYTAIYQTKQQRLAEISRRLEEIQQEQHQLLQEAADLIAADAIEIKIPGVKLNS
ncbi:hypothetical protein Cylst_1734 [Cylindrospermum stagnale PCC 7417]|uniref:Uncharacterized protein n=1 Tax=Cylindrospermum stagnale PCC 7417 TaxID=56107 RepID=K9WUE2_9NOST|nr:hypothetical protein [Cylindrospermum stagnale]AFZ24005.1 hypothetical protein Cylst_1734 [Cylindrospermum stagnale PCC 7417]